jgi:hypothetical protein
MKMIFMFLAVFTAIESSASTFTLSDDIVVCVKKPVGGYAPSWELVMLKKSQGVVVYQNSSGGNESDPITDIAVVGSKIVVQHDHLTKETVTFDLRNGTASWVEDAYPRNVQVYPTCQGFKEYDFDRIRAWFKSVVETEEWRNR